MSISPCALSASLKISIARYKGEEIPSNKNSAGVLVQSVNHATGENSWKVRNRELYFGKVMKRESLC